MPELSQSTKQLIQKYQSWHAAQQRKEDTPTIHVDEVASAVAAFYEKIREMVDWREEHLIRRAAIERILKRRLLLVKNGEDVALPFVLELIRGGHFPNDRIPESKINPVKKLIDKYLFIIGNSPHPPKEKIKTQLFDWILGIAACEVEEVLSPPHREKALIEYMMESMIEKLRINNINEEEKNTQIYIAVQRSLLNLDPPIINYNLLKRKFPDWPDLTNTDPRLEELTKNIYSLWNEVEKELKHPLAKKFYKIAERYDTPYLIMGDIISEDPMGISEKIKMPETLENGIASVYKKRLNILKARVKRAAIYATLSIFLTKMLLAFAIEVPFDKYLTGQFSYSTAGLSILIPPLLMFFLVLTIKPPKEENLQQVIMETMKIAYQRERKEIYQIESLKRRRFFMHSIVTFFYFLTFLTSFGLIIWVLRQLNFSPLSVIIFLVFISLISFAGIKIRERSRELEVTESKESALMILIDFFSLPVIQVGKWLSSQWKRYNIVMVLINFLVDLPFQIFVEFLEQWRNFLKEKKEEIQ
ncbi:MAG: hypothetical protein ABIG08_00985 [bacterium]